LRIAQPTAKLQSANRLSEIAGNRILGRPRTRLLDPMERISEILFGLIMVLTLTCSVSIVGDGEDAQSVLLAALGCNLAWGLIDAVFYLMARFSEQERGISALRALRSTTNPAEVRDIIGEVLPPLLASVLTRVEFGQMQDRLMGMRDPPERPRLTKHDLLAALGIFLLVFLSTLPVVIPLLLIADSRMAIRASNGVALVMLFALGCAFGRYAMRPRWVTGLAMVLLGSVLVAITVALGG
jgi:VIT1/CCC1 family predicted Fe2+/Mn2+ transporter